jgi:hypothetical protein
VTPAVPRDERGTVSPVGRRPFGGGYFLPWFFTASIDAAAASGSR